MWGVLPITYNYLESVEIIDTINDTLRIIPKINVSGSAYISLTLYDKDYSSHSKDLKINVNSLVTESTPKVTLTSPYNNAIVNTLTPTLEWELDYEGPHPITFTVYLDHSSNPDTEIKTNHNSMNYTLEDELVDGGSYFWKVVPINGICNSEPFMFTIDLDYKPIYEVNITAERNHYLMKQGQVLTLTLTIENRGNMEDEYTLEFNSKSFTNDNITIYNTNFIISPDRWRPVSVSITIPEDIKSGIHPITFTVKSINAMDNTIVNIEILPMGDIEEPTWDVSIDLSNSSVKIDQGLSEIITLVITNEGNMPDNYTISYDTLGFADVDINLSKTEIFLAPGTDRHITTIITVSEDALIGEHFIKFKVESDSAYNESYLGLTIYGKTSPDKSGDDEDNTMLYAGISIIVIIIIIVIILLFIFLKKKKEPEAQVADPEPKIVQSTSVPQPQAQQISMQPQYFPQPATTQPVYQPVPEAIPDTLQPIPGLAPAQSQLEE
jgi:hypothetical protein